MEFANTSPVVNVEMGGGSLFLHDEVAQSYLAMVRRIERVALSKAASMDLVRDILESSTRPYTHRM